MLLTFILRFHQYLGRKERLGHAGLIHTENLAHLVSVMGASRVVLGTDYPFDMGQENPVDLVDAVAGLTDAEAAQIKGDNAIELLGLR